MSARPEVIPEPPFAGCARAFEAELDYVYRTLRRHGVHWRDAEDLTQEVFLVMCRRWSAYDPGRSLRSWLAGIAIKIAHRHHRRSERREIPCDDVDPADEAPGPDEQLASSRVRAVVLATISHLPEKYRGIFVMHELDGVSVKEIADALGMPLFTVHTRLRRARLRFAAALRNSRLALVDPQTLLAVERRPVAVPPEVRQRLQARLSVLALNTPPVPPPAPLPLPWIAIGVAALASMTAIVAWRSLAPHAPPKRPAHAAPLSERGLSGHWSLEETRGVVARDSSSASRDCRIHGVDLSRASVPGVHGRALDLGTTGWLECPQPPAAAGGPTELTVSMWFRRAHTQPQAALMMRHLGPGAENYFYLGFQEDNLRVWSGAWTGWATTRVAGSEWTHVAFAHRGRETRLYVNGEVVRELNNGRPRGDGTADGPLVIGAVVRPNINWQHFDGAVDEVRVYDRALDPAEIAGLARRP